MPKHHPIPLPCVGPLFAAKSMPPRNAPTAWPADRLIASAPAGIPRTTPHRFIGGSIRKSIAGNGAKLLQLENPFGTASTILAARKQGFPRTSQRLLDFHQGGKGRKIFPRLKALHIARTHPHRLRKRLLGHSTASAQPCNILPKNKAVPARTRFDGWHDAIFANGKKSEHEA